MFLILPTDASHDKKGSRFRNIESTQPMMMSMSRIKIEMNFQIMMQMQLQMQMLLRMQDARCKMQDAR